MPEQEPPAAAPPCPQAAAKAYLDLWERNLGHIAVHGPTPHGPAPRPPAG
jgi:hypothetical protein